MNVDERWVVLGLAHVRSPWFGEVARWATAAVLPVEFVKCLSVEEIRSRLGSGRAFSALLIDALLPALDRDLIDTATSAGCAVLVVESGRAARDWRTLGASAVLAPDFDPGALLDVLAHHAPRISQIDRPLTTGATQGITTLWRGRLIGVLGGGGTGTSTVAMALAAGLGADARHRDLVLLADLALHADQALLHHVGDVVPGIQELVEANRLGSPGPDEIRSLTMQPPHSPYAVLLGLRRHREWTSLRPRAVRAAIDGLRRTFTVTVADLDPDLEGEAQTGSMEVEERNHLARTVASDADLVVVTGLPSLTGTQRLVRLIHDVVEHGVDPGRVVPLVNQAPRSPSGRAEITAAIARMTAAAGTGDRPVNPVVFVSAEKRLDLCIRDVTSLPKGLVRSVAAPVQAVLDRVDDSALALPATRSPERIVPGSLGSWGMGEDVAL